MNKCLAAIGMAVLLLACFGQHAEAQYGPFSTPQDPISSPLVSSTDEGAAPLPSTEIAPGSTDLLAPTTHVSPYDPLDSSLESTVLSPYVYDQANSLAPGAINTGIPDAAFTLRSSQAGVTASSAFPRPGVSSWKISSTLRHPLSGSAAPSSLPVGSMAAIAGSTWGVAAHSQPPSSAWSAGSVAPPEPPAVATLRAIPLGSPQSTGNGAVSSSPALPNSGAERGQAPSRPGALVYDNSSVGGQPGKMGNFQNSTTGSAYAPQASPTPRPSSLLWSRAAEQEDASPFRDMATTSFLSPTLTPPLLSGNSLAAHTLERERGGLNGAQNRLQANIFQRSEMPSQRRRAQRMRRYRNPILEQMEEQSSGRQ